MTEKEFRDLKIGDTFRLGIKTLKVENSIPRLCENCYFFKTLTDCFDLQQDNLIPYCSSDLRDSKTDIIFIEVENDK